LGAAATTGWGETEVARAGVGRGTVEATAAAAAVRGARRTRKGLVTR